MIIARPWDGVFNEFLIRVLNIHLIAKITSLLLELLDNMFICNCALLDFELSQWLRTKPWGWLVFIQRIQVDSEVISAGADQHIGFGNLLLHPCHLWFSPNGATLVQLGHSLLFVLSRPHRIATVACMHDSRVLINLQFLRFVFAIAESLREPGDARNRLVFINFHDGFNDVFLFPVFL